MVCCDRVVRYWLCDMVLSIVLFEGSLMVMFSVVIEFLCCISYVLNLVCVFEFGLCSV